MATWLIANDLKEESSELISLLQLKGRQVEYFDQLDKDQSLSQGHAGRVIVANDLMIETYLSWFNYQNLIPVIYPAKFETLLGRKVVQKVVTNWKKEVKYPVKIRYQNGMEQVIKSSDDIEAKWLVDQGTVLPVHLSELVVFDRPGRLMVGGGKLYGMVGDWVESIDQDFISEVVRLSAGLFFVVDVGYLEKKGQWAVIRASSPFGLVSPVCDWMINFSEDCFHVMALFDQMFSSGKTKKRSVQHHENSGSVGSDAQSSVEDNLVDQIRKEVPDVTDDGMLFEVGFNRDQVLDQSGARYRDGFFDCLLNGFLPAQDPLEKLPERYSNLQSILDQMSIYQPDDHKGYLAYPFLIDQVRDSNLLDNHLAQVEQETDVPVIQALYRGYCFLASALLLEPSYQAYVITGEYGRASRLLPAKIAQPLWCLARKLDVFPWLEYSYAYSLGNYSLRDSSLSRSNGRLDWENLRMAVSFSRTKDEEGFIMVHVDLNQFSRDLVHGVVGMLAGCGNGRVKSGQGWTKPELIAWLKRIQQTMAQINSRRREMWKASDHRKYNDFRVFIMGIRGNDKVFGEGVRYQGISREGEIVQGLSQAEVEKRDREDGWHLGQYRGQSGSQDTIIPMMDTVFRVVDYYPQNDLTEYLMDMRQYRPKVFQRLLEDLDKASQGLMERVQMVAGNDGLVWYLAILDQIYKFRNGHWQFVQKYIMANTKYPVATGGTPIISWIPNQIEATLMGMKKCLAMIQADQEVDQMVMLEELREQYPKKVLLLNTQMEELRKNDYNVEMIYQKNLELGESDLI